MNAIIVLVAATALGIEYGWEPLPGGGHEYTLQIEPPLLKVLESGQEEIFSDVPEGVNVRRYRIVVGVGKLRRDYGPLEAEIERPRYRGSHLLVRLSHLAQASTHHRNFRVRRTSFGLQSWKEWLKLNWPRTWR